jgi:CubicO group peptidase (beta-lactamase class C family)
MRRITLALLVAACGGSPRHAPPPRPAPAAPTPHKTAVSNVIQPMVDAEIASAMVIGLYDGGKTEVYGFGKGPGGAPPTATTLFEIGSVTKVYTSLLFADAIQRREVALDQPVSELLPTGVSVPTRDGAAITLKHLALHSSGLPRLPSSIAPNAPDPYAKFDEETLYKDLAATKLEFAPGQEIVYSNYGVGLLGFALGKKLGTGYARALTDRILTPLGLKDTFITVPAAAAARRATGTNTDLKPVAPWTFDVLAPAGALISDAHDQLALIGAELDAAAGGKQPLRAAMRLTQEPQLDNQGPNEGLGWQIDAKGRYWHNGETGGFHSYLGFDPKTRRGIVILSATALMPLDNLADVLYDALAGKTPPPVVYPTPEQLAPYAGHYDFQGMKINVVVTGKRLYVEGPGEGPIRMVPLSDKAFWLQPLQSIAIFEKKDDKVAQIVFQIGEHQLIANRID